MRAVVSIDAVRVRRFVPRGLWPRRFRGQPVWKPRYRCHLACGHTVDRPGPWGRRRPPSPPKRMRCSECERLAAHVSRHLGRWMGVLHG